MSKVKEPKIAYYWAIYKEGIKKGDHPSRGYDELQVCTFYSTHVAHKPYYGDMEYLLHAVKLIHVGEGNSNYPTAVNIFESISMYFSDLQFDESGFVEVPATSTKKEVCEPQEEAQKSEECVQLEIDLGTSIYDWD
jgi:hypothetical protein